MGIFDRFGSSNRSTGRTFDAQRVEASEDEQALERYRYMLRTAPPETIEQAHQEAFAKLTPQQRRMLLEQLLASLPPAERAYAADNPASLARIATRAEVRQPGTMEQVFTRMPAAASPGYAGPGLGGMFATSLFGSVAGTVLGTMVAQHFLGSHGLGSGLLDNAGGIGHGLASSDLPADANADYSDLSTPLDDFGSGGGDFDAGSFDT